MQSLMAGLDNKGLRAMCCAAHRARPEDGKQAAALVDWVVDMAVDRRAVFASTDAEFMEALETFLTPMEFCPFQRATACAACDRTIFRVEHHLAGYRDFRRAANGTGQVLCDHEDAWMLDGDAPDGHNRPVCRRCWLYQYYLDLELGRPPRPVENTIIKTTT